MAAAVEQLEAEFSARLGLAGAVAAGFGRSALLLALESLPVRDTDVLVPDFICAQVPEAVRRARARPVFYPVQRHLSVAPADFQAAFTPQTRAAIVAHYFGRVLPQVSLLAEICRQRRVSMIEDCALALGASAHSRPVGTFGELAVFSFTKSDWCYGGGIAVSNRPERLARMRALREQEFRPWNRLCFRYGLLRRADFAANRPALSRVAEHFGRALERMFASGLENFYDAGRFDSLMPSFAARRARRMLAKLPAITAGRRAILQQLTEAFRQAGRTVFRFEEDPGDAASFLLIQCAAGRAHQWRAQAARAGVTLRCCWPAFQHLLPEQESHEVRWLADHLLLLELHPRLTAAEAGTIASTLPQVAAGRAAEALREKRGQP